MKVLENKRWTNKVAAVAVIMTFIGLNTLNTINTSENNCLGNKNKKSSVITSSTHDNNIIKKLEVKNNIILSIKASMRPNKKADKKQRIKLNEGKITKGNLTAKVIQRVKENNITAKNSSINKINSTNKINSINKSNNIKKVNKIVREVAYNKSLSSRGGYERFAYSGHMCMEATAYTSSYSDTGKSQGDPGYGITASGTRAKVGTVAVDPNVIPLGTRLYIKSLNGEKDYGYAVAEDTGGAIKNMKVDLYFNTEDEAIQFGRKKVTVYILK